MIKRLFDIIFSLLGIILISPLFLIISFLIKRESPGPVFFRGVRVGKRGKEFRIFKFRTMVVNAEKLGGPSTSGDDPRLLKIGHFLKRYQLDELPQLINVLEGDMSLVGPRPEVRMYVNMMSKEERRIILSVKPGMTDLASLWNFHESDVLKGSLDPEKTYQEKIRPTKIRLQMRYVKNRSFLLDLKIIIKTIIKLFY
ncbi:MAG: sugar transferase [Candidatus Paceibacterota bacterium]|jgi:lipopolysaccharide/colanic/teichoic acid biosynthesis glycosyltransferase